MNNNMNNTYYIDNTDNIDNYYSIKEKYIIIFLDITFLFSFIILFSIIKKIYIYLYIQESSAILYDSSNIDDYFSIDISNNSQEITNNDEINDISDNELPSYSQLYPN
tara:strand:- start:1059 stop:1382 length:324 start_codon:yes stop_codon:yes gene_type:complete